MEDAATAEIARAQLCQWLHHRITVNGLGAFNPVAYARLRDEEAGLLSKL